MGKSWRAYLSEAAAAPGDALTLGFTSDIRKAINGEDPVDKDSGTYKNTKLATTLASLVTGAGAARSLGAAAAKAGARAVKKPVKGTGTRTLAQHEKDMVRDQARRAARNKQDLKDRSFRKHKADKERRDTSPEGQKKRADFERQKQSAKQAEREIKSKQSKPSARSKETQEIVRRAQQQSFARFKARQQHG